MIQMSCITEEVPISDHAWELQTVDESKNTVTLYCTTCGCEIDASIVHCTA